MKLTKEQYNDVPVFYCKECLSLNVRSVLASGILELDYCDDCGGTIMEETHIEKWKELYKERYGFDYLNNTLDGREK